MRGTGGADIGNPSKAETSILTPLMAAGSARPVGSIKRCEPCDDLNIITGETDNCEKTEGRKVNSFGTLGPAWSAGLYWLG